MRVATIDSKERKRKNSGCASTLQLSCQAALTRAAREPSEDGSPTHQAQACDPRDLLNYGRTGESRLPALLPKNTGALTLRGPRHDRQTSRTSHTAGAVRWHRQNCPPLLTINAGRDAPRARPAKDSGRESEGPLCPTARAQLALRKTRRKSPARSECRATRGFVNALTSGIHFTK